MMYEKLRQPKLAEAIEQQLEQLILRGELQPGVKLPPERQLAQQLAVSRTCLREAIQRLATRGLLYRRQGGGTFVQSSLGQQFLNPLVELLAAYPESQFDLLETRYALEGITAYYAALRASDEEQQQIEKAYHAILSTQQSADHSATAEAVMKFQLAITRASHNVVLIHLLTSLAPILQENIKLNFEHLYANRAISEKVDNHRLEILNAIKAHKPDTAREASQRHLKFIEEILLELTKTHSRQRQLSKYHA